MFSQDRPLLKGAAAVVAAALLAGCGSLVEGDGRAGGADSALTVGTTSAPTSLDPAGAWDGSWELFRNVYQTLLYFPASGGTPEPDAAQRCAFTDKASSVYRCVLREGLAFSNGNPLDAEAVKYSLERTLTIEADTGPAQLLQSIDRIETSGDRTVVFHLRRPDATFPLVLATPAASLVDPSVYPADRLLDSATVTGSGPYRLASYEQGERAELVRNREYEGSAEIKNAAVTIRYFEDPAEMVGELGKGGIDLTYRGLTPEQISDFRRNRDDHPGVKLSEVYGTEIRYLVFNPEHGPAGERAVRRAVAQVIDREALVSEVYEGTAAPLYSMVPSGITGHTSAYHEEYGDEPGAEKARATLEEAGITGRVPLTLWYTTDRYGADTEREFREIERQLEESGLFEITLEGRRWREFQKGVAEGEYQVFGRGWFPDFPDADNYISPFVGEENVLGAPYEDADLTGRLLPRSRRLGDRGAAGEVLAEAQKILAEDARLLPLWQGKLHIAARDDVAGVEWSIDSSTIMRMWELSRKKSW
ncbi:ABC transporter substrate-binding protein [Streptomyces sp. TRM 70361]|uniref:ABC transporter substrate-binding protein n=1 Tax=Streptomyces sp. TRM 70361 TaxID=3116553 RepID=UPI002E7B525B|nr:ABC transporter substrate-binding protein [Streptomyces sp. TRM 70361]MEE1942016.1 ABC transporter substrate-binding protein [Streptomyces sp. TRM 70361]